MTTRRPKGFTLIEVLVALALVAMAMITGLRSSALLIDSVERQSAFIGAQACASTVFSQMRAQPIYPPPEKSEFACEDADSKSPSKFTYLLEVSPTPNPSFRKAQVTVKNGAAPIFTTTMLLSEY